MSGRGASVGVDTGGSRPLTIAVGEVSLSPCDQQTFVRFKQWLVTREDPAALDEYVAEGVAIRHWDEAAGADYPHLLNPCECGTYLPLEVEPGPMLSSAIGLLRELQHLRARADLAEEFRPLVHALMRSAERSIARNQALEIR